MTEVPAPKMKTGEEGFGWRLAEPGACGPPRWRASADGLGDSVSRGRLGGLLERGRGQEPRRKPRGGRLFRAAF